MSAKQGNKIRQKKKEDSFFATYKTLCELHKTCPLPIITAFLEENIIDLNADKLSLADWKPFLESFRSQSHFKFIGIRSFTKAQNGYFKNLPSNKFQPAIKSPTVVKQLCEELEILIGSSTLLYCLELQNLQLTVTDLSNLAKGIHNNNTIRHLSLEQCPIEENGLRVLAQLLGKKMNVTSVNFSHCGLASKSAEILAELIQAQSMYRHSESWKDSLRYRCVDLDNAGGLRRITLNSNPRLGNRGAEAFANAIKDDVWLKALDLTSCGISLTGARSLLRALSKNSVLQILDLRLNNVTDKNLMLRISQHLNFNTQGHNAPIYKWLNLSSSKKPTKPLVGHKRQNQTKTALRQNKLNVTRQKGIPWHVAARLAPDRGLASRFVPGVANIFLQTATSSEAETELESVKNVSKIKLSERDERLDRMKRLAKIQEDLQELRLCLDKEVSARRAAELQVAKLTKKNQELEERLRLSTSRRMSDDDATLDTIQETFTKFYNFLAILQKAGMGKLIAESGFTATSPPHLAEAAAQTVSHGADNGSGEPLTSPTSNSVQRYLSLTPSRSPQGEPERDLSSTYGTSKTSTISSSLSEEIRFTSGDEL